MKYIKYFEYFKFLIKEGINTTGTYLNKHLDNEESMKSNVKDIIDKIVKSEGIKLPVKKWDKDFIKIKDRLYKEIQTLKDFDFMKHYLYGSDDNKKLNTRHHKDLDTILKKLLVKFCCDDEVKKIKTKNNDLDVKDIDFEYKYKLTLDSNEKIYQIILPKWLKDHIIQNKDINSLDYLIYISCESKNFNRIHFPGRAARKTIFKNHNIEYFGRSPNTHWTSLLHGIPSIIKRIGIGYRMYKQFIQYLGYASSSSGSSDEAMAVWKKLVKDDDLCGIIINYKFKDYGITLDHRYNKEKVEGGVLVFDKKFQGDFKKVCEDFIKFHQNEYIVVSIVIDDFLKSKNISEKI